MSPYDSVRARISTRLLDAEASEDFLRDKIWRRTAEFALLYRVEVSSGDLVMGIPVTREMFDAWGADEETLYRDAMEREERLSPSRLFCPFDPRGPVDILERPERLRSCEVPQYLLTNSERFNGASVIARLGLLERVAEIFGCGYTALPTSIHAFMLVPDFAGVRLSDMEGALRAANRGKDHAQSVGPFGQAALLRSPYGGAEARSRLNLDLRLSFEGAREGRGAASSRSSRGRSG